MKKTLITGGLLLIFGMTATTGFCAADKSGKIDGKKGFLDKCASCHPNGGNIINKQKPLTSASLKANGITSSKDIVGKMRNPGKFMPAFDGKILSSKEAAAIADYILKTFK